MKRAHSSTRSGFALVLTLIVLTLLAIGILGFFSSTTLDRVAANAAGNKAQAEFAAQGAANRAITLVTDAITRFPDSATVWETVVPAGGGPAIEGTMLYYADVAPNSPDAQRWVLPLLSTGTDDQGKLLGARTLDKKPAAFGSVAWDNENSTDINRPLFNGDKDGWVGAAPEGRHPLRAKWIDVKDRTVSNPRTTSRYAFWIEDESFRLNLNQLGASPRGGESPGKLPAEVPYQGLLRNTPGLTASDALAQKLFTTRIAWLGQRLPELRSFNEVEPTVPLADKAKFLSTIHSGGLNLSRHGSQRVNLNGLGFEAANPSAEAVEKGIRQTVETLRYHAPKFGQRFYRSSTSVSPSILNKEEVTSAHQEIYLNKVAANIRDYIDPDLYPTILLEGGKLAPKISPVNAFSAADGPNEVWAQGKDSAPFLQETMVRFRGSIAGSRFDLRVDYYIEFWNMTDKDVYAAPQAGRSDPHHLGNAFLRIADQVGWVGTDAAGNGATPLRSDDPAVDIGPSAGPERDVTIDLITDVQQGDGSGPIIPGGVVFRAGTCTVITTDPDGLPASPSGGVDRTTTFYCPHLSTGYRQYRGPVPTGRVGIKPQWRDTNSDDYGTEVILGNNQGYLESMPYALTGGGPAPVTTAARATDTNHGGSLFGNSSTPSQLGDPRTNNEQITYTRFRPGSTSQPDQTRYFNQTGGFTLGSPNSGFVNPHLGNKWGDYYKGWDSTSTSSPAHRPNPGAQGAPAFILNAPLPSIGELGDIFDPARVKGTAGTLGVEAARGGGRTFKIGQPDDRVDFQTYAASSRQWASYRLTDFFSTTREVQLPGLININGIRRDNGAALRAACFGMTLHVAAQAPDANSTLVAADKTLENDEGAARGVQKIVSLLRDRMEKNDPSQPGGDTAKYLGPLMERGELGDLNAFSTGTNLLSGVKMDDAFDRTREELTRRMIDLITTRGSVFSVYAVGQSITEGPPPARKRFVTATHQLKITFQLIPVWKRSSGNNNNKVEQETWDPADAAARTDRFRKPDHYDVQILQASS